MNDNEKTKNNEAKGNGKKSENTLGYIAGMVGCGLAFLLVALLLRS